VGFGSGYAAAKSTNLSPYLGAMLPHKWNTPISCLALQNVSAMVVGSYPSCWHLGNHGGYAHFVKDARGNQVFDHPLAKLNRSCLLDCLNSLLKLLWDHHGCCR
jgi:hypothetical protein